MGETTRKKCGCEYRSNSTKSVRHGYELGGYLVKRCPAHQAEFEATLRALEAQGGTE